MAIELQISEAVFVGLVESWVQSRLNLVCQPPLDGVYLDHLDTVAGATTLQGLADGRMEVRIAIDVFVAPESTILAAPNTTPAVLPAGKAIVALLVGTAAATIVVSPGNHDLTGLAVSGPIAAAIEQQIDDMINSLAQPLVDLTSRFTDLGLPAPVAGRIDVDGAVVAIRFDPAGPMSANLLPATEWGLFLDTTAIVAMAASRFQGIPATFSWAPSGTIPRVLYEVYQTFPIKVTPSLNLGLGTIEVPFTIEISVRAWGSVTFSLTPGHALQIDVTWDFEIRTPLSGFTDLVDEFIKSEAKVKVSQMLLDAVDGAVPAGPNSFYLIRGLAPVNLLDARLLWRQIAAVPGGMVLGGPVEWSVADRSIPPFEVSRFGKPFLFTSCRARAQSGSGAPPAKPNQWAVEVNAGVDLDGAHFCAAELAPPNAWLQSRLQVVDGESAGFVLKTAVAKHITSPVRFVLRTSRGCRLIDFGVPEIIVDEEGTVTNANVFHLWDCIYFSGVYLKLATGERLTREDFKPDPLEYSNWLESSRATLGLKVLLIRLRDLEPGEIVRFQSPHHRFTLTADAQGAVLLPAVLPLSQTMAGIGVRRFVERPFPRNIDIAAATFWRRADTDAGAANWLDVRDGTPLIIRKLDDAEIIEAFVPAREEGIVRQEGLAALNPQPLPPGPPPELGKLVEAARLTEVRSVHALPGFEHERIAIAVLSDGNVAIVDGESSDGPRISGRWEGSLLPIQTIGDHAGGLSGDRFVLFSVDRAREGVN